MDSIIDNGMLGQYEVSAGTIYDSSGLEWKGSAYVTRVDGQSAPEVGSECSLRVVVNPAHDRLRAVQVTGMVTVKEVIPSGSYKWLVLFEANDHMVTDGSPVVHPCWTCGVLNGVNERPLKGHCSWYCMDRSPR